MEVVNSQYSTGLALHKLRESFKTPRLEIQDLSFVNRPFLLLFCFIFKDLLFKSPEFKLEVDYRC